MKDTIWDNMMIHQATLDISKKIFVIFVKHRNYQIKVYPNPNQKSMKKCKKNYHYEIRKHSLVIVLQSQIFTLKKAAWIMKIIVWINKAAKTQRHIKKNLPILPNKIGFSARVFLRLLINILVNQAINPMAQRKKTSFVKKENLNQKSSYVFANFVPSGFFNSYINIDICIKKGTGPKRLRSIVLWLCCRTFFLFAFGAFFQDTDAHKALPIKSRRGAGARSSDITSYLLTLCKNVEKKQSFLPTVDPNIVSRQRGILGWGCHLPYLCGFFFFIFTHYGCIMHHSNSKKTRNGGNGGDKAI